MIAVSCSPRSPVTRHGDPSRWTGEPGLERGSANPELAIAFIRQLARTGVRKGGGDQAGRLRGAPAGAAGGPLGVHHVVKGAQRVEELRVHHRASIPPDEARAVLMALLASGRLPPMPP